MTTAPLVSSQSDYNYYSRTMIALSEISMLVDAYYPGVGTGKNNEQI